MLNNEKKESYFLVENCIYTPILGTEVKINQRFSILEIFKNFFEKKIENVFLFKSSIQSQILEKGLKINQPFSI